MKKAFMLGGQHFSSCSCVIYQMGSHMCRQINLQIRYYLKLPYHIWFGSSSVISILIDLIFIQTFVIDFSRNVSQVLFHL